jgi:uncharacterized membrane protein YdjX (TVP38/TMEM64 family)
MATTSQTNELIGSPAAQSAVQFKVVLVKAAVLLVIAMAGAVAYRFTPLKEWLQPAGQAASWVRETGLWGAAIFLLGMSVLILVGVPRLLFCPVAGAVFGFWGGLGISIAGTMISYYTAFRVIRGRRTNGDVTPPLHPKLAFLAGHPGLPAVTVSRMVPVPGMIVTLALSMSNVRTRIYLLGSLVGLIPEAAPLVLLGAGLLNPGAETLIKLGIGAFVCILVAALAIHYLVRRFKNVSQA